MIGGLLLLLSLGAMVLGVFGAIYLDQPQDHPSTTLSSQGSSTNPESDNFAPSATTAPLPVNPKISAESPHQEDGVPAEVARNLATLAPSAGPTAPPSDRAAPSAGPGPEGAPGSAPAPVPASSNAAVTAPGVRVVFATYGSARKVYAERLKQKLAALGLDTTIDRLRGHGGRHYYSVRSPTGHMEGARAAVATAQQELHLSPLIHRDRTGGSTEAAGTPYGYSVQFGVLADPYGARILRDRLVGQSIEATIAKRRRADGTQIYVVKSWRLPTRQDAEALAQQAMTTVKIDALVLRAPRASARGAAHRVPRSIRSHPLTANITR